MRTKILTIYLIVSLISALAAGPASAADYTHIWIDQATGTNSPDTPGTPDEPFKSITYALAVADFQSWPDPWHVHIGPGVYDANRPGNEKEIFPIKLRQAMLFEGADCADPNNRSVDPNTRIIDGQHLILGLAPLLLGQNCTGLQIRNLTLRNMAYSEGNGGAAELIECAGKIENCIVRNNKAKQGGGLWLSPRTTPVPFDFIACTFTGNSVFVSGDCAYGGGFFVNGTLTGDISDCAFTGNSAGTARYAYGGGFIVNGALTGSITDCIFVGNSASAFKDWDTSYAYGGGFYVNGNLTGNVSGCSFAGNSLSASSPHNNGHAYGGGFYVKDILTGNISSCRFTDNSTGVDGYAYGGGFLIGTLNGTVTGCDFTENTAHAGDARGGGFYCEKTLTGDIKDSIFTGNIAKTSGAAFRTQGSFTGNISDSGFYENAANIAVYFNSTLKGSIKNCDFINGETGSASDAVYVHGDLDGTIKNCSFSDFARNAVCLANNSGTEGRIRSCLFVAPETLGEVSGWAINTNQNTVISNNTIVGPGLGAAPLPPKASAIYIGFNTQAENGKIFNNIVVDTQCAIHVDAGVDMPIKYNLFDNVNEIVCQGEQGIGNDIWWLEYNLSNFRNNHYDDPLFVPGDPMYHLEEDSPCKDAGDPNYVSTSVTGETDIDVQPRVMGDCIERVDIGADEIYFPNCWNCPAQCHGDADCDGSVKGSDFLALKDSWYKCYDDPNYNPCADFDRDGCVKGGDFLILKEYWYQTPPADCNCCGQTPNCYWPPIMPE